MFIFSFCVNIFILIKKHSGAARYLTWAKLWLSDCQLFFRYRFWFHSPHQGCSFSLVGTKMDVWKLNWTAELVIYSSGLKASTGHWIMYMHLPEILDPSVGHQFQAIFHLPEIVVRAGMGNTYCVWFFQKNRRLSPCYTVAYNC